jgi:membrane protein CcdC involved in cytochrome C biogenesis
MIPGPIRFSIESRMNEMRVTWKNLLLPVVLMATGAIVLASADFGLVSLDRVQNLWPAALILVGLVELLSEDSSAQRGQHE